MQQNQTVLISLPIEDLQTVIIDCVTACLIRNNESNIQFQAKKSDKLLTTKETQAIYKVSSVTLWNWRKSGLITGYRQGKLVKYKESEIMDSLTKIQPKK